jgi:hypothetical protein
VPEGAVVGNRVIPKEYLLQETATSECSERTILNIKDADGTLIILPDNVTKITDGTILTIKTVAEMGKPYLIVYLSEVPGVNQINSWIAKNGIQLLNIAGPRESRSKGIHDAAVAFIEKVLLAYLRSEYLNMSLIYHGKRQYSAKIAL